MRRRVYEVSRKYIIEEFDSYDELLTTTQSREVNDWCDEDGAREKVEVGRDPWSGEKTFDDAVNHLKCGCDTSYKKLRSHVAKKNRIPIKRKPISYNNVVGFQPNVPAAIMGLPKSMIDMKMAPKKAKIVDLIYDMTASCKNDADSLAEYGTEVLQRVQGLEENGYRVRISVVATFGTPYGYDTAHGVKVKIKSENQPLDLKRVSYPLVGKGMFRRIMFDWYESGPDHEELSGYGSTIRSWDKIDTALAKEFQEQLYGSGKSIYICCGDDLDEVFKEVEGDKK